MKNGNGNGLETEQLSGWERAKREYRKRLARRGAGGLATVAIAVLLLGVMFAGNAAALTPQEKLDKTISNIQTFLIGIGIALAGVMVILAGTKWVATRGHPEEQARVKHWLMDIGIGCILILSSTVLIEVAKGLIVK